MLHIVHFVGNEPPLNIICGKTKLMVTYELSERTFADVWQTFFFERVLGFLGPPQLLVVDAAREFISKEFCDNCAAVGIELLEKVTEAHWSFGVSVS